MDWNTLLFSLEPFLFIPVISLAALGIVYMFGRMLGIVNNYHVKNVLAIISILAGMYLYSFVYRQREINPQSILDTILYFCIAIIFYVLVCFRLYDRIDSLLDRVAKDDGGPTEESLHKKKHKPRKKKP